MSSRVLQISLCTVLWWTRIANSNSTISPTRINFTLFDSRTFTKGFSPLCTRKKYLAQWENMTIYFTGKHTCQLHVITVLDWIRYLFRDCIKDLVKLLSRALICCVTLTNTSANNLYKFMCCTYEQYYKFLATCRWKMCLSQPSTRDSVSRLFFLKHYKDANWI